MARSNLAARVLGPLLLGPRIFIFILFQRRADFFCDGFLLTILVCLVWPLYEAITFETGDHMHVWMLNYLPGVFAIVHHEIHTITAERLLNRNCDSASSFCNGTPTFRINIKDICRVCFRDDECVPRVDWVNVEKGDRGFILKNNIGRKVLGTDFAK